MTQKEFARLGGQARSAKLSKERKIEIARNAGLASTRQRAKKPNPKDEKRNTSQPSYWLITLKAEDCFSSQAWEGKPIAQLIALTPTRDEPDFSTLMNAIVDDLGIGSRASFQEGCALSYSIGYLADPGRDKLPAPQWDSENLKLWVVRRAENA